MEALEFTKSHGTGNDFIIVENFDNQFDLTSKAVAVLCNRHYGIGADGFLIATNSEEADFQMIYFNADGSRAEMCGNGLRCLAKYLYDRGHTSKESFKIETLAGIKKVDLLFDESKVVGAKVEMGSPSFAPQDVPILVKDAKEVVDYPIKTEKGSFEVNALSVGNPHCVVFVENVEKVPLRSWGYQLESHPLFPEKTNVEFVQVVNKQEIKMRVWERGVGETLACGTGACAAVVAAAKKGLVSETSIVKVAGGELVVEWRGVKLFLAGPAEEVFVGFLNADFLGKLELVSEFEADKERS